MTRPASDPTRTNEGKQQAGTWWVVAAGVGVEGVVILSLDPDVNPASPLMDYLAHAAAYALLAIVLFGARDRRGRRLQPSMSVLAMAVVAFGAAMEVAQAAVGRDATVADVFADTLGVGVALTAFSLPRMIRGRRASDARRRTRFGFGTSPLA